MIMLLVVGTINVIYGIGALDDANYFINDTRFILSDLNTLGWVLIILGAIQFTGGFSLFAGNVWGRIVGIAAGTLGALGALFSIGGSNPWWSLAVFALRLDRLGHHRVRRRRGPGRVSEDELDELGPIDYILVERLTAAQR